MPEFWVPHRVYLDTDPLRAAKWPRISNDLRLFLKGAAAFHMSCFVPEPVLRELEENWKREVATDEGRARDLNSRYGLLGLPQATLPSVEALLPAYRAAVGTLLKETGAAASPMTTRSAMDANSTRCLVILNGGLDYALYSADRVTPGSSSWTLDSPASSRAARLVAVACTHSGHGGG